MLVLVTPAAALFTAAEVKARVPALSGAADAVVEAALAAGTAAVQGFLGRALGVQTWDWKPVESAPPHHHEPLSSPYWLTNGPWGWRGWLPSFALPLPPLVSVASVKYLDADGVEQTFNAANYIVSGVGGIGRVSLKSGASWPAFGAFPEPIRIRFTAGTTDVPDPLLWAVLVATGEAFAAIGRDPAVRSESVEGVGSTSYTDTANMAGVLSPVVRGLAAPYRVFA